MPSRSLEVDPNRHPVEGPSPSAHLQSSARSSKHGHHGRRRAGLNLTHGDEAVALVQRDVPRIRRLEIGWQTLAVTPFEGVAKERGAKALVLIRRVDPNHWEVPVRSIRMESGHLVHERLEVSL